MNKKNILNVVAIFTRKIASKSANSSASMYYVYQPKVPKILKKSSENS